MFGMLIGTLSLIGLIRLARGGGRWGHGGHRGGPRRWMLRRLYERLDITPGQEKVMAEVLDDAEKKMWAAREQFKTARTAYARAVKGEHFDGAAVGEAFDAQQAALEELKKSVREGLGKVHEALNPEQRKVLGDLIEYGPRAMHGGGCGHGHFGHHHRGGGWREAQANPSTVNL
jgi:Spy/CpxP family protein refolding chaperone